MPRGRPKKSAAKVDQPGPFGEAAGSGLLGVRSGKALPVSGNGRAAPSTRARRRAVRSGIGLRGSAAVSRLTQVGVSPAKERRARRRNLAGAPGVQGVGAGVRLAARPRTRAHRPVTCLRTRELPLGHAAGSVRGRPKSVEAWARDRRARVGALSITERLRRGWSREEAIGGQVYRE